MYHAELSGANIICKQKRSINARRKTIIYRKYINGYTHEVGGTNCTPNNPSHR